MVCKRMHTRSNLNWNVCVRQNYLGNINNISIIIVIMITVIMEQESIAADRGLVTVKRFSYVMINAKTRRA